MTDAIGRATTRRRDDATIDARRRRDRRASDAATTGRWMGSDARARRED
jgi:hypothetical protein